MTKQQTTLRTPPMKPTPAMLAAAREEEDGWRRMPYPEVRHKLLWEAMLRAWNEECAGVRDARAGRGPPPAAPQEPSHDR